MRRSFVGIFAALLLASCNVSVNETIEIADGERVRGSQNTVNGSVIVGRDCQVEGDCRTVNGQVEIGDGSLVQSIQSVNGRVRVGKNANIDGDISTVNGSVRIESGTEVRGAIESVNGSVDLENARVTHDIRTNNGSIFLYANSTVAGDVVIEKSSGNSSRPQKIKIKIADGSVVEGDLIVEDPDVDVRVYLSKGGRVAGKIDERAELIRE